MLNIIKNFLNWVEIAPDDIKFIVQIVVMSIVSTALILLVALIVYCFFEVIVFLQYLIFHNKH
jgi:hypothetical protein